MDLKYNEGIKMKISNIEKSNVIEYQINLNDDINRKNMTINRELRRIEDISHLKYISPDSKTVLCIGARDDSEVLTFINSGYDAIGIDICTETNLITKLDMAELTPAFGMFDIVYCSHVLEHIIDPHITLSAIRSIAKKCIFVILPIVNRPPDIEHPTVYEIMKHTPSTNFKNYPQAWEDFGYFRPCDIVYNCYRNASSEEHEVGLIFKLKRGK